jgi:glycine/serine hydroxymethyltransferase
VQVAEFITRVIAAPEDEAVLEDVRNQVKDLTSGFSVPGITGQAFHS